MDRGYIYLNKKSYLHNIEVLKNLSRKELCLVVKANAYGHGLEWAVKNAKESGVKWFAVASVDEGIEVKKVYGEIEIIKNLASLFFNTFFNYFYCSIYSRTEASWRC